LSAIQNALDRMNANRAVAKEKGTFGEQAVIAVVQEYQGIRGGTIIHSFMYKYASNRQGINYPGNIHREADGSFKTIDGYSNTNDEIDIVYITPYRIFAIEAKARSGTWKIDDLWCLQQSTPVDKSPLAQAEKHARHLYHSIYEYLPDGNPNYIVPMTVFVDKARVMDSRSSDQKFYLPVTIVNTLKKKIRDYDTPLKYELDTVGLMKKMMLMGKGQVFV
jgi:hypothetical protein